MKAPTRRYRKTKPEHPALIEARELWAEYERSGVKSVEAATETLYFRVFGEPLKPCNCSDRIHDALILIINTLKKTNILMSERQYILKRGVVLHIDGETYTRVNITDEVAKKWAKKYPDAKVWERQPATTEEENAPTTEPENDEEGVVNNEQPATTEEEK